MRITSGKWKGFPLDYPKDRTFRPTQEKVRSAVFNVLQYQTSGADFLDLYCGTGAMGFEAISRGASTATLVDSNVRFAEKNRESSMSRLLPEAQVDARRQVTVVRSTVPDYLRKTHLSFDVIFMDPPWDQVGLYEDTFRLIAGSDILRLDGVLCCEYPKRLEFALPSGLAIGHQYAYSDTMVSMIFRREVTHASGDLPG
jgi:16S rRNA (guanine(966)-N(2))-methyltransferase RsmD